MASVVVRPADSGSALRAFIDLPFRLYADDPYWVPTLRMDTRKLLNPKKNAFFDHGTIQPFLAYDHAGRVVGRIAAIENGMHLKTHDDGVGFFGFFEVEERTDAARALLDAAATWLAGRGLKTMRGPTNPSLNDTAGLLVDGFESSPFVLMTHNPPFYERQLLDYGFERSMTLWAYFMHRAYMNADRLKRGAGLIRRRYPNVTIRTLRMDRFQQEAALIRDIYNDAWSENWGFVPMTEREFAQLAAEMKQVVDPEMAFILEEDGEAAAFAISIPNINLALRHVRNGRLFPTGLFKLLSRVSFGAVHQVRMPLMGVRKAYQGRSYDTIMLNETVQKLPPMGFSAAELSWVLDSNVTLRNNLHTSGAVAYKEYALFDYSIA